MKPNTINQDKCTFCKLCLRQCSSPVFSPDEKEKKISIIEDIGCIACGHCIAICPVGALSVDEKLPEPIKKYPNPDELLLTLRSRRSMRKYEKKQISDDILLKLTDFIRFAPTGSNSESTRIIFLKDEKKRRDVTKVLMRLYIILKSLTSFFLVKWIFYLIYGKKRAKTLKKALDNMIKNYKSGRDPLFFNAPVIIFIYTFKKESSTPKDDSCYALYNAVLGAESFGLSTCINQLAVISFNSRKRKVRKILELPRKAKIYASASLGYPGFSYKRVVFRKEARFKIL
jgi:nitroreductase/NAD-dependent dihydropyrimidine dehydrogenase PreA subunit